MKYIAQFTSSTQHIFGASNVVADTLSRLEVDQVNAPVTMQMIVEMQLVNKVVK